VKNWDVKQVVDDRRNSLGAKSKVPINTDSQETLMLNEDICVTEHGPDAFAFLRMIDGYTNDVLRESLDPEMNKDMVFKAGESQGKSGSFFFFSKD
jgi:hypothetical protein